MIQEQLVGVVEAAKAVGMGTSALYRMAKEGLVPSYTVGPQQTGVRFAISELKRALRRRKPSAKKQMIGFNRD